MTQILCGITSDGIMVATDSMATTFDQNGKERYFTVDKLFSLGSHAFIVSGGMGISVDLSKRFIHYAEKRRLVGIEALIASAGAYLSGQLREVFGNGGPTAPGRGELDRIYFVVGGYSFRSRDNPYQLALWGSEGGQLSLQRIQVGSSLAVPRTMSGETSLYRICREKAPLLELVEFSEQFLEKLAKTNPQVGPPFRFGIVTPSGFRRLGSRSDLVETQAP